MSTQAAARLLNNGWSLQQKGDLSGAISQYEAVLREPTTERKIPMLACLNIGNIAFERRDYDEARKWYTKAIDANPSDAAPYYNLANVFRDANRYQDAIANYKRAIEKDSNDPDSRRNLALVYARTGENRLAADELKTCIQLKPGADVRDYFNLGLLYYQIGNQLGAVTWLDKFVKAAPAGHSHSVIEAKRLLSELKGAAGFARTRKKLIAKDDGAYYLVDEE